MTVAELIAALVAECDPEWNVYIDGDTTVAVTMVTPNADDGYVDIS